MTFRILAPLAMITVLPVAGFAQADITPGLWAYEATYQLGPVPLRESGTYCLDQETANTSYETLLNGINDSCRVTSSSEHSDGFHFTMRCSGGPDGEITGNLSVANQEASLIANGWTGTEEENFPVSLSASASKLSSGC